MLEKKNKYKTKNHILQSVSVGRIDQIKKENNEKLHLQITNFHQGSQAYLKLEDKDDKASFLKYGIDSRPFETKTIFQKIREQMGKKTVKKEANTSAPLIEYFENEGYEDYQAKVLLMGSKRKLKPIHPSIKKGPEILSKKLFTLLKESKGSNFY